MENSVGIVYAVGIFVGWLSIRLWLYAWKNQFVDTLVALISIILITAGVFK